MTELKSGAARTSVVVDMLYGGLGPAAMVQVPIMPCLICGRRTRAHERCDHKAQGHVLGEQYLDDLASGELRIVADPPVYQDVAPQPSPSRITPLVYRREPSPFARAFQKFVNDRIALSRRSQPREPRRLFGHGGPW